MASGPDEMVVSYVPTSTSSLQAAEGPERRTFYENRALSLKGLLYLNLKRSKKENTPTQHGVPSTVPTSALPRLRGLERRDGELLVVGSLLGSCGVP